MFHVKHLDAVVPREMLREASGRVPGPNSSLPPARSWRAVLPSNRWLAPRHDRGRVWVQVVRATSHHPYIDCTERCHPTPVFLDLFLRPLSLDGDHSAV